MSFGIDDRAIIEYARDNIIMGDIYSDEDIMYHISLNDMPVSSVFSDEAIIEYVRMNKTPDEIFSVEVLLKWASSYLTKAGDIK